VGIALGLGAALSWGFADYFASVASRAVGALRVVLGFHLVALIPLAILVLATNALAHLKLDQLPVFVLLGVVGWLSYLSFYGALAIGPISVLSPIVSGYAAVTVVLAVLISSETLSAGETAAVVITILGAMVASANVRAILGTPLERRSALGFVLALSAMALLGGLTVGTLGFDGFSFADDLSHAGKRQWFYGFVAGVIFNFANMLLMGAVSVAGMAVAFPLGMGSAVVIGSLLGILVRRTGNPVLLLVGCLVIMAAMAAEAFAYMASFDNAQEWDPSVVEASRLDSGELKVGSAFRVVSTFAGRKVPLRYEITVLDADRRVVLEAWNGTFGSVDTITVVASGSGSSVTYDARLVFKGISRLANPIMQLVFNRVGRKADASLRTQLNRPR